MLYNVRTKKTEIIFLTYRYNPNLSILLYGYFRFLSTYFRTRLPFLLFFQYILNE